MTSAAPPSPVPAPGGRHTPRLRPTWTDNQGMNIIGVRHEDKNRWERRVPLTPAAVASLVGQEELDVRAVLRSQGVRRRCLCRGGATVVAGLDGCDVVLAVKEIPAELLRPDTAYVFFSHTIKGQAHSMPLLQRVLDVGATLIDYELIVDADGRRLVHFGRFAGLAGMVDALWAFGQRWHELGFRRRSCDCDRPSSTNPWRRRWPQWPTSARRSRPRACRPRWVRWSWASRATATWREGSARCSTGCLGWT